MQSFNFVPASLKYILEVIGVAEAVSELETFDGALANMNQTAERSVEQNVNLKDSVGKVGLGFVSAASEALSLWTQYDNLEKLELKITIAEKNLDSAKRSLIMSQAALDELVTRGITSGAEYEAAVINVDMAQQQLNIANEHLIQSQGNLTQQQLNFGLVVLPTVFNAIQGIHAAIETWRTVQIALTTAQSAQTIVNLGSIGSFTALTAATMAQTFATNAGVIATRLFHLAMGPIGWTILGVSTFLGLFATNAFGVRDAMNAVGKAVGDALLFLQPLLNALAEIANTLFPQTEKASSEAGQSMAVDIEGLKQKHEELYLRWQEQDTGIISSALSVAQVGGENMNRFAIKIDKVADSVVADARRMEKALSKVGAVDVGGFLADPRGESKSSKASSLGGTERSITVIINMDGKQIAKYFSDFAGDTIKFV